MTHTLLVPEEREGNEMILSLQNVLANPKVALLFIVPGTDRTLRVQGRATLTCCRSRRWWSELTARAAGGVARRAAEDGGLLLPG